MSLVSQMFGLSSSVAYTRCGGSGNNTLSVLSSLAAGYGTNPSNGVYVYNLFNAQSGFTQSGFRDTDAYTTILESLVSSIAGMTSYSLIGTASIIYSYANFPNIQESSVVQFINSYCQNLATYMGGTPSSISVSGLSAIINEFSVNTINGALTGIGSNNVPQKAINYNWYDASVLFPNTNFNGLAQTIKDSESQYYFISGELLYPSVPQGLTPCFQFNQTISTPTGNLTYSVIANSPCFNGNTYVGPISGVKFFRKFSDGPGSSGYFDSATEAAYVSFDELVLNPKDYSTNSDILYSNDKNSSGNFILLKSGEPIDIPGFFNSTNEYGVGVTNILTSDGICQWGSNDYESQTGTFFSWSNYTGYGLPLMRMHQGDNQPKWNLYKFCSSFDGFGHCLTCSYTGNLYNWTGWKYVQFQLADSLAENYQFLQTNPTLDTGRIIKRILNLDNYSGINGPVTPYASVQDNGNGSLTCTGIVGPPQMNGNNATLPGFAFYQTFDNSTFPDYASITMKAACISGGTYDISNYTLLSTGESGVHFPVFAGPCIVPINQVISSPSMSGYDDITKKCLSMGDCFGGTNLSGQTSLQSNAGYLYTGYTYMQSGQILGAAQLLALGSQKIGSTYSTINYISGYTGIGGTVYSLSSLYAFIITGNTSSGINYYGQPLTYQYYSDGVLGAVNTGWSTFAPIPSVVQSNPSLYGPVYVNQNVENYLPRYLSGPYLSYETSFLYPNAQAMFTAFNSVANAFPQTFYYDIQFNEENVTEIYCLKNKYGFTTYPNVIRAVTGNVPSGLRSSMVLPFAVDNNTFGYQYSFANTGLYINSGNFNYICDITGVGATQLVDANYVPSIDFTVDPALNSTIHNKDDTILTRWYCGIKINNGIVPKTYYTGINKSGLAYVKAPAVKKLFWGYYGNRYTGLLNYTLPIYDLESESMVLQTGLNNQILTQATIPIQAIYGIDARYYFMDFNSGFSFNGSSIGKLNDIDNGIPNFSGQDPISYTYIGGRVGAGADSQGGNNAIGIMGDSWYDCRIDAWGGRGVSCDFSYPNTALGHAPELDSHVFFFGLNSSGLTVNARSLNYYPFYFNRTYQPYTSYIGNVGVNVTPRWLGQEYYFDFDLSQYFSITSLGTGGLYSQNGLNIGPFDRDIELCVSSGNYILPSGYLVIDGQILNTTGYTDGCYQFISNTIADTGIYPNPLVNRSPYITTFKLIPKGQISNINISGNPGGIVGITPKAIVTIRPRTFGGDTAFQPPTDNAQDLSQPFGDAYALDFSRFINNGTESVFKMPTSNSDFNSLQGKSFSFQTTANQYILYPKPGDDFTGIVPTGTDKFGNTTYPPNPTAYYWSVKTPNAFFTGMRDVTRVNFTINQITVSGLGQIPYQSQHIIIPSGDCIITGLFGYTGQAESAVISDGIVLSGISGAVSLSGLFQPIYVSDVLNRLSSGLLNIPSGINSGSQPVLPAPSYMKQRQNISVIQPGSVYIGVTPYSGAGYNAFLWPAWSDLALLNPEVVYEQMPPDDGNVFMNSYLTFSAAQGQAIGATGVNLNENVSYQVTCQYGFIDSVATNAVYNTGACVFTGDSTSQILDSGYLSGILTSQGNSLTMALNINNYST